MRACACWQHGTAQHQHTAPPPPCQDDDQPVAGKSHWPVTSVHPVEVHLADTVPTVKLSNPTHTVFVLEQTWPSAVLPHCAIHLSESSQGTFFMPLIVAQGGGGAAAGGSRAWSNSSVAGGKDCHHSMAQPFNV